jgi:hypothetical protein
VRKWWLDELDHVGREHLDAGYVGGYERKAGFDPDEDLEIMDRRALGMHSRVIDIETARTRWSAPSSTHNPMWSSLVGWPSRRGSVVRAGPFTE